MCDFRSCRSWQELWSAAFPEYLRTFEVGCNRSTQQTADFFCKSVERVSFSIYTCLKLMLYYFKNMGLINKG